jgi:hypothetical protein
MRLQQKDAEAQAWAGRRDAGLDAADTVEANGFCRLLHPFASSQAHICRSGQDTIYGSDRNPGGFSKVWNGGSAHGTSDWFRIIFLSE